MSNAVDELSLMIGRIESDVKHTRKNTEVIGEKVDKLTESVIKNDALIRTAQKKIDDIHPYVEDYKKLKQRGVGILTTLSMIFGALGAFLSKIIGSIF